MPILTNLVIYYSKVNNLRLPLSPGFDSYSSEPVSRALCCAQDSTKSLISLLCQLSFRTSFTLIGFFNHACTISELTSIHCLLISIAVAKAGLSE